MVLSHPVQYYSPWFQWLRAHTRLQFKVFYLWEFGVTTQHDPQFGRAIKWDIDLLSHYDYEFVPNVSRVPGTHHFGGLNNPLLTEKLAAWRPEVVLYFGYKWRAHLTALLWARAHGIPALLRGDSHLLGRGRPSATNRVLLGLLFRQFAGFLPVGQANHDYFRAHGVPAAKLHISPHSVNAARFNPNDQSIRNEANRLRAELGLANRNVMLFAGKLHPRKQPLELLHAFQAVATEDDALVFVGDGELRDQLKREAATRPDQVVRFLPFANQSEMPARYALADVFALPSRGFYETWGLAVNEAMHLGVPCLVSDLVGCQRDLVTPSKTGWVFPANDSAALAAEVRTALRTTPEQRQQLRRACLERIAGFTYQQTTDGLLHALASLSSSPKCA